MRKRCLSLLLAVVMICTLLPLSWAGAVSVSGRDIVDKAMEYIGKVPYVWGGTKIDGSNPGADCSGFICRIYEKFGIDMWAYRTKLRNYGTNLGTDLNVAKLGDIIWFDGHVAIYAGKDSGGNHMIVHETGGDFQNVVYTKVSVVRAELKGVIRIPGVDGDGLYIGEPDSVTNTSGVTFSMPTDSNYTSKQKITNTNAVVVNKITKPAGVSVNRMGVILFDENDGKIFDHSEYVSNVKDSTKTYHSWFDINSELHVTLTPGTKYKYQFYGYFDGQKVAGPTYTFTTTGKQPVARFWLSDSENKTVALRTGYGYSYLGQFPQPYERDGYTFAGWYTDPVGGTKISLSMTYTGISDVDLYPHYTKNEVSEPEVDVSVGPDVVVNPDTGTEPEPEPEPETYTLVYMDLRTMISYGTYTVQNGDKYPIPSKTPTREGYTFAGWFTSYTGGTQVTASTTVNLTKDQNLYPHWTENAEETNTITLQIGSPYLYINGVRQTIDAQGTVPLLRNDRTLLPVRAVVEAMGGTVGWIGSSETVVMNMDGKSLNLQIGSKTAWSGAGVQYSMDVAPILVNDRTMLPIRFIVEYFDGTVSWADATQTVTIQYAS